MATAAKLHFLPGLGADARLFIEQRKAWPDADFPSIPVPHEDEAFSDFAFRWADAHSWSKEDVVVGFAFGGVMALEAARCHEGFRRSVGALVLVSSCRTSAAVTGGFRKQVALSKMIPGMMMRRLLLCFAERFSPEDALSDEQRELLKDMAAELDLDHLRWASNACCEWKLTSSSELEKELPVFQIHGENDSVIPLIEGDPDFVLPSAGHLLQYTHAGELQAYIRRCVAQVGLTLD